MELQMKFINCLCLWAEFYTHSTEKTLFHGAQGVRPAWGLKEKGVFCQEGQHPLLSDWSTMLTEIVVLA